MVNPNINAFTMAPVQGEMDLQFQGSVVSAQVASTQVVPLVAGQYVKIVDDASPIPKFVALAADSDIPYGAVARNLKDADFPANAGFELAMASSVMYMTAGAAIARGAKLEFDVSENKVITNAGTNPVCGFAYDKAAADGDLIRVWILSPFQVAQVIADVAGLQAALDAGLKVATVTATLAEINAGKALIAGVTGKSITVTNFAERVSGAFITGTSVDMVSDATSVNVASAAQAQLTNGAVLLPGSAGITLGAGFAATLPANEGLKVQKTGSNFAGGTSITFVITYKQA